MCIRDRFRVRLHEAVKGQVRGDDRRFLPQDAFVDAEKELGRDEAVGQFRT